MSVSLSDFIIQITSNPALFITVLLTLVVILVNGWTNAPNAIATCVLTRSLSPKKAIVMAAVFNFLGVLVMTMVNKAVAETIYNMVDLRGGSLDALVALCTALFTVAIWVTAASYFGIQTSESYALIAGIFGAVIALQGGLSGINGNGWVKVLYGIFISTVIGLSLGYVTTKLIELLCKRADRRKAELVFKNGQILGGAAMAFMHGAQDGQKFMGVFLLGMFLANGQSEVTSFVIPIWLIILCSFVMALGTFIGGYRIRKSIVVGMVKLDRYQGFAADVAAISCLLVSSFGGIPVSTTLTKTTSIMGVEVSKRLSAVNWRNEKKMVIACVLTFLGCGLVSFLMAHLFMKVYL